MPQIAVKVITDVSFQACPLCREALSVMPSAPCPQCSTLHHAACLAEMACGAMECFGQANATGFWLDIDGERLTLEPGVTPCGQSPERAHVTMTDGTEWLLFADRDDAVAEVATYLRENADELIEKETLIEWGLAAMNGETTDAQAWIDDAADSDLGAHMASYDGEECTVARTSDATDAALGFVPDVAFRVA